MKIVIPMAGKGLRYNNVLFHSPKPLIEIDGKPMIAHVVNMFSADDEFIFLCHEDHLRETKMQQVLQNLVPKCTIVPVTEEQRQGGPVNTSLLSFPYIGDGDEVIVNYCDFTMRWEYRDFLKTVRTTPCDGAMPSFRGFHPASLGDTYYCYMKYNPQGYMTELREKEPFQSNRLDDYASTGTYYFKTGKQFKHYFQQTVEKGLQAKGESYATLPYLLMMKDGLQILNYEVEKFICLGTPRDYEIYKFWSEFFFQQSGHLVGFGNVNIKTQNIFPLAGGERGFTSMGFDTLNFLMPLMNKPLVASTVRSHPRGVKNVFICLQEHKEQYQLDSLLQNVLSNPTILYLPQKTAGNAQTILQAASVIDFLQPVCVNGPSYILDYDDRKLGHLMELEDIDVIAFSFTHHECILRDAEKHTYVRLENGRVTEVCEKRPISDTPYMDHALTGTTIYRRGGDLFDSINKSIVQGASTSNYYLTALNELIKEGKKVVVFEVDKFISLLNPIDYQEFLYWQDYFDSLPYHPYSKMVH
jgi:NDP-sugar pyrophosphorylase family protein